MKMAKRIFAAACALSLACSMAACGSSSSDSSSSKKEAKAMTDDQKEQVNALQDKLPDIELSNKTIKWMAHYDINPSDGKSESPAISLFQTKYGGKIEYVQTTWDNRYTDLAKAVMANDSPDFFPADDMDAFPKGAIKAMFEPIDDVVDFSSDIWSSSQTLNDSFVFNGKHYVAAIDVKPQYVCTYNTKTISDFGYDDPAELYANDEWTWSKFTEMCLDFADSEADRYALDGYLYVKALNDTCGYPLIGLEDGKLVNNMGKAEVGTVQDCTTLRRTTLYSTDQATTGRQEVTELTVKALVHSSHCSFLSAHGLSRILLKRLRHSEASRTARLCSFQCQEWTILTSTMYLQA